MRRVGSPWLNHLATGARLIHYQCLLQAMPEIYRQPQGAVICRDIPLVFLSELKCQLRKQFHIFVLFVLGLPRGDRGLPQGGAGGGGPSGGLLVERELRGELRPSSLARGLLQV